MKDESLIYNVDDQFDESIAAASKLFFKGKIFVYPTDTIHGIGGNPFNQNTVKRISDIKGRSTSKQFIWLVYNLEILLNYAEINYENHLQFLESVFPAPVSIILNLNERTKDSVGFSSAAFRIPDNLFCRELLAEIKLPLISTSVNRSGEDPLNDFNEIKMQFGNEVDAIFYSDKKNVFSASTVIDLKGKKPVLVREGSIKFVELLDKFN